MRLRKLTAQELPNLSNWFCLNDSTNMPNTIQIVLKWQFFPKNYKNRPVSGGSTCRLSSIQHRQILALDSSLSLSETLVVHLPTVFTRRTTRTNRSDFIYSKWHVTMMQS